MYLYLHSCSNFNLCFICDGIYSRICVYMFWSIVVVMCAVHTLCLCVHGPLNVYI